MFVKSLPGFCVSIGDPETHARYDEYSMPADDDTTTRQHAVKYVAATPGKIFCVYLDALPGYPYVGGDIRIAVEVDGQRVHRVCVLIRDNRHHTKLQGPSKYQNGVHIIQQYTFGQVRTTEGPAKQSDFARVTKLGEITVKITRCKRGIVSDATHTEGAKLKDSSEVPEKALKGRSISTSVSLTSSEPLASIPTVCRPTFPWGEAPIATYTFLYRSRRDLQAELIIPRTPSPAPLEERNPEDLTIDEARELIARQRTLLEHQQTIKKEEPRVVKRERPLEPDSDIEEVPNPKRSRLSTDSAIEVIDLSGD